MAARTPALRRVRIRQGQGAPFLPDRLPGRLAGSRERRGRCRRRGHRKMATDVGFVAHQACRAAPNCSTRGVYCARGRMENMIKEDKLYTKFDRTSCHRYANQIRLFLTRAAYWLLHQLCRTGAALPGAPRRLRRRRQAFSFPSPGTGVIEELITRIKIALLLGLPISSNRLIAMAAGAIARPADPSGACRRIEPERQSPTRNEAFAPKAAVNPARYRSPPLNRRPPTVNGMRAVQPKEKTIDSFTPTDHAKTHLSRLTRGGYGRRGGHHRRLASHLSG